MSESNNEANTRTGPALVFVIVPDYLDNRGDN